MMKRVLLTNKLLRELGFVAIGNDGMRLQVNSKNSIDVYPFKTEVNGRLVTPHAYFLDQLQTVHIEYFGTPI